MVVAATETEVVYPAENWRKIALHVAAAYVYDLADDFDKALQVHVGESRDRVAAQLEEIIGWWDQETGQSTLRDWNLLLSQEPSTLEIAGSKLWTARYALKPLVFRHPDPARPDDTGGPGVLFPGQSDGDFGKAITVNGASTDLQEKYMDHQNYAGAAYVIRRAQLAGVEVTQQMIDRYLQNKLEVTPEHYTLLAAHQVEGFTKWFGNSTFDETKFADGLKRFTVRGEMDMATFGWWHWLRWIDNYLAVLETGVVSDIVTIEES